MQTTSAARPDVTQVARVGPLSRFVVGAIVGALSAFGPGGLRVLAGFVATLAWTLGIRKRVTLDNLRHAFPELSERERQGIGKRTYRNMTLAVLESVTSIKHSVEDAERILEIENPELIDRALEDGKGVILATAHFGSWELLGEALCRRGIPLNAVVRPLAGALNERIVKSRLESGMKLIHPRGAVQSCLDVLARNEVACMLVDQSIGADRGVFVPFFGRLASTAPAVSLVAQRSGSPVYVMMAVREGDGLRMTLEGPFPMPNTGDSQRDIQQHLALITATIEKWIRRYPDQWMWLHRRWKVKPPDVAAQREAA